MRKYYGALLVFMLAGCLTTAPARYAAYEAIIETREHSRPQHHDTVDCAEFLPDPNMIKTFFSTAEPVSPIELHNDKYLVYGPCKASGKLVSPQQTLNWTIYLGGIGYLWQEGEKEQGYGCRPKCCRSVRGAC